MPVSSQLIKRLLVETLVLDIVSKLSICRSINIFTYILGIYTYIYLYISNRAEFGVSIIVSTIR